jgi:hypothetical protein
VQVLKSVIHKQHCDFLPKRASRHNRINGRITVQTVLIGGAGHDE